MTHMINEWHRLAVSVLIGSLTVMAGCTRTILISDAQVRLSGGTELDQKMVVTISAEEDVRRLADRRGIALTGELHICGLNHPNRSVRYGTIEYLDSAVETAGTARTYQFEYPSTLHEQVASFANPNASGPSGWPVELVKENGVCFWIEGATMFGPRIESNVLQVPEAESLLLN